MKAGGGEDRKSTRLNSSHRCISYAVFCLNKTWDMLAVRPRVTLLNPPRTKAELAGASWWVAGDGRAVPFRDAAFDVVFSNSVIEHVGDAQSQRAFAREVARVGRAYWVQTPNRWFPVEQHLLTP